MENKPETYLIIASITAHETTFNKVINLLATDKSHAKTLGKEHFQKLYQNFTLAIRKA
jgi:hypothetical protein